MSGGAFSSAMQGLILLIAALTAVKAGPMLTQAELQIIGLSTFAICALRLVLPVVLSGPLFDYTQQGESYDSPAAREACRFKFCSHANKFLLHLFFQVWGVTVLLEEPWFDGFFNLDPCWEDWKPHGPRASGPLVVYYLSQLGFFTASMMMQFVEARAHDHVAMLMHHWGAGTLVLLSFLTNTHRFGLFVLVVRELTDVMIHLARGLALLGWRKTGELILVLLMVMWAFTRNYYHTFVTCMGAFYSPTYEWQYDIWLSFNILLGLLVPLDAYYLYLGLAAIVRRIMNPNQKNVDPDVPGPTEAKKND